MASTSFDRRYRALVSRDARFDGVFVTAVTSTGVFCRPMCPSRTPLPSNVRFYANPEAARAAGFRPCKRCRPESSNLAERGVADRALGLIADGRMDDRGVSDLAACVNVGARQLRRSLLSAVGTPPLRLARSRRAQTAHCLLTATDMAVTDIAYAAGFGSIRQFNQTMRATFGATPTQLRRHADASETGDWVRIRLRAPQPYDARTLFAFLGARTIKGVDSVAGGIYSRALRTAHGVAVIQLEPANGFVHLRTRLDTLADLGEVVRRSRRLLDLDTDTAAIEADLCRDALLRTSVRAAPGQRLPGAAEPFEMVVRAVLGQQVSVAGARTLISRLAARLGRPLNQPVGDVVLQFPEATELVEADLSDLGITGARIRSLHAVASAVVAGAVDLAAPPAVVDSSLSLLPGFGPWTRAYIAMRALGDPDAFPAGDLAIRRAFERANLPGDVRSISAYAERWRPWRAYAAMHLWHSLSLQETA
ncbi:MAG: helix-turn-helix domain-containing protein [Actinobacteria bacterium]|nr:helix-turn-helix domain-containing protein [Actinomycetota bacterium]